MNSEWLETASHNRIHKSCMVQGSSFIAIQGDTIIDRNCTVIVEDAEDEDAKTTNGETGGRIRRQPELKVGKQCFFKEGCSVNLSLNSPEMVIGSWCIIGNNSVLRDCAAIGSRVIIGKDCRIDADCTICDCCIIEDGAHLPSQFVVPSLTKVSKNLEFTSLDPCYRILNEETVKNELLFGKMAW